MTYQPERFMGEEPDDDPDDWDESAAEDMDVCDCFCRLDMLSSKACRISVAWKCPTCGNVTFDKNEERTGIWETAQVAIVQYQFWLVAAVVAVTALVALR